MKVQMLKTRPAPGSTLPCYIKGCTYTLATEAELKMGQRFVAEGAAKDVTPEAPAADVPAPAPVEVAAPQTLAEIGTDEPAPKRRKSKA